MRKQKAGEPGEQAAADFDAESDLDLLREVLSAEKPPSKIIPHEKP